MEDARELNGDITTTHYQHALGQLFKEERLVRANGVLAPWNLRDLRPAAGGDQDVPGSEALTVDLHLMGIDQACMPFMQGHAAVDQQVAIDTVEAVDLTILVGDQGRPIKVRLAQGPAKAAGLFKIFGKMRAVHQQLLWHTADVHTGAAQVAALRHSHLGAKASGKARRANTAGTGANYIQVKIVGHFTLLGRTPAYRLTWG